tara:strand:- start:1265 stop:1969 length:705 start_codon:yes stop_codon:yes gene_type:complete
MINLKMGMPVELTPEEMEANFKLLMDRVGAMFESRSEAIYAMYKDFELEVLSAPASSVEYYHNAFPGGYLDHILRVLEYSFKVYELWKGLGMGVDDFTLEELAFVAIHHDLGKLGFPHENGGRYIWNNSEWHRKNQGKIYDTNPDIPFMKVQDMSLYMLQKYGIPLSFNETMAIKLHDGLYDDVNKAYYITRQHKSGLRTNLVNIIHQADLLASKFEYERWAKLSGQSLKKVKV